MYTSYFGLKENPFNLTPDPRYLYLSPHHKEAFDYLLYGINERKGFIAITGGIGTGKTTLCRSLLSQLDHSVKTALIFNSFITERELLEIINQEFGIKRDPAVRTKKEYIDKLNGFLLENFSRGGNAVLLIDEAQNLSDTVLEQIRMLSNLETEKEKLIQIVLVGQTELKELLAASSLRQLDERILVRYELRPLDRKDVQGYVEHRLVVAGGRGNLKFTGDALEEIYKYSQGNPRRINAVCDRALLIAYAKDEFTVSRETVQKGIEDVRGKGPYEASAWSWPWKRVKAAPVLLIVFIALLCFTAWSVRSHLLRSSSDKGAIFASIPTNKERVSLPIPKRMAASVFLDEQASRVGLFKLFWEERKRNGNGPRGTPLDLISFDMKIENYGMLQKPFRILMAPPDDSQDSSLVSPDAHQDQDLSAHYLLVQKVSADGAIAVDTHGKKRPVTRDFLQTHWGQKVSWVYPHEDNGADFFAGMRGEDVLLVQKTLKKIGYQVETTGIYDDTTVSAVMKFQEWFGMETDGIVGHRTRALLYQMTE